MPTAQPQATLISMSRVLIRLHALLLQSCMVVYDAHQLHCSNRSKSQMLDQTAAVAHTCTLEWQGEALLVYHHSPVML